jgi:hypothetical protein
MHPLILPPIKAHPLRAETPLLSHGLSHSVHEEDIFTPPAAGCLHQEFEVAVRPEPLGGFDVAVGEVGDEPVVQAVLSGQCYLAGRHGGGETPERHGAVGVVDVGLGGPAGEGERRGGGGVEVVDDVGEEFGGEVEEVTCDGSRCGLGLGHAVVLLGVGLRHVEELVFVWLVVSKGL